jgi:hypothetical protein
MKHTASFASVALLLGFISALAGAEIDVHDVPPYACLSLPPGLAALISTSADADSHAGPAVEEDLLDELRQTCYQLKTGYWTYELCPFRRVSQSHSPRNPRRQAGIEIGLGRYDPSRDVLDGDDYWQTFAGGEGGRSTRVRYSCPGAVDFGQEADLTESLTRVDEQGAQYQLSFASGAVCRSIIRRDSARSSPPSEPELDRWRPRLILGGEQQQSIVRLALPHVRLLAPLKGRCFQRAHEYWHYKFCPGKSLRQFHPDPARNGPSILLGRYDSALDELSTATGAESFRTATHGVVLAQFSQRYVNGISKRSATVHVACSQDSEMLLAVSEPTPLSYTALFLTPLACDMNCVRTMRGPAQSSLPLL